MWACTQNFLIMAGIHRKVRPFLCLKNFKNSDFTWKNDPRFNLLFLKARKMLALNKFRQQCSVDVDSGSIKVLSVIFHGLLMQNEHFCRNALTMHPVESAPKKIIFFVFACAEFDHIV